MAHYHLSVKCHSRSANANAVALASYRSGERLFDDKQQRYKNCRKYDKSEVLHNELFNNGSMSRERLWNKAEEVERRKNSVVAKEIEIGLPCNLSNEDKIALAQEFCRSLVKRYNCAIDLAVHAPDADGDQRNYHAHILMTTRVMKAGHLTDKWRHLNQPLGKGRLEVSSIRKEFEELQNKVLEKAGREERVFAGRAAEQDRPKAYKNASFKKYQVMRREGRLEEYKEVSGALEFERWKEQKDLEIEDLVEQIEELKYWEEVENNYLEDPIDAMIDRDVESWIKQQEEKERKENVWKQNAEGASDRGEGSVRDIRYDHEGSGGESHIEQGRDTSEGYQGAGEGRVLQDETSERSLFLDKEDESRSGQLEQRSRGRFISYIEEGICEGETESSRRHSEEQSVNERELQFHQRVFEELRQASERSRDDRSRTRRSPAVHPGDFRETEGELRRRVVERRAINRGIEQVRGVIKRIHEGIERGLRGLKRIAEQYKQTIRSFCRTGGFFEDRKDVRQRVGRVLKENGEEISEVILDNTGKERTAVRLELPVMKEYQVRSGQPELKVKELKVEPVPERKLTRLQKTFEELYGENKDKKISLSSSKKEEPKKSRGMGR